MDSSLRFGLGGGRLLPTGICVHRKLGPRRNRARVADDSLAHAYGANSCVNHICSRLRRRAYRSLCDWRNRVPLSRILDSERQVLLHCISAVDIARAVDVEHALAYDSKANRIALRGDVHLGCSGTSGVSATCRRTV